MDFFSSCRFRRGPRHYCRSMTLATFTDLAERDDAIIARRREGATLRTLSAEFQLSTGRISTILKGLPAAERHELEHQTRSNGQDGKHAELRAELLADLAPCGSPACRDPECDVPAGYCHHCRTERVKLAKQTHGEDRTVRGYPLLLCSRSCVGRSSRGARRTTSARVVRRRALVADAWLPDSTPAAIAETLGIRQQTLSRDLIALEAAGAIVRRPANEARTAALAKANENKAAAVPLALGGPGGCGSPTCLDLDCKVPHGRCHFPGCPEPAATPKQSHTAKRHVAGIPALCCSRHVAWLANELREHRARGLVAGREAAAWLGVVDITPYLVAELLTPDERGHGGVLWFTEATLARFERQQARRGNGWTEETMEGFYRSRWLDAIAASRGVNAALEALERSRSRAAARRKRLRARRGGAPTKELLRTELREILAQLDGELDLRAFGRNEILAMVGERAWDEGVGDFREKYPAAVGGLDLQYRKPVLERVGRLIGHDLKALLTAAT
jgi:hypothetical protein